MGYPPVLFFMRKLYNKTEALQWSACLEGVANSVGFDLFFTTETLPKNIGTGEARRKACKESLRLRVSVVRAFPSHAFSHSMPR